MARKDLLESVVEHLRTHGLGDQSLREIAAAVGTSHRMLSYHFGSRAGLLAAVVDTVESQERDRTVAAAPTSELDPTAQLAQFWAAVSQPRRANEERLFFELAALALRDEPGTETLRANLVEPWLAVGARMYEALPAGSANAAIRAAAREVTRLDVAVIRGLLLDLLATGDRRSVDASFRRYLSWRDTEIVRLSSGS